MSDVSEVLDQLLADKNLNTSQAEGVMDELMSGDLDEAQIGALLTAMRACGESADEIAGFARTMREHAKSFDLSESYRPLVDTCGTGGDSVETINISTLSALAAAGADANVAKHGNRSVSSRCGSADLLEELGVKLELTPDQVEESIRETGIGFMYAPSFHASMKHAIGPRKSLGVRTIFNLLGPLTNPADADRQLVGVFGSEWVHPVAEAMRDLGVHRALVVHGTEGMDEISPAERTVYAEVEDGELREGDFTPEDFGVEPVNLTEIEGGGPEENARITRSLLNGDGPKPVEDTIAVNAGAVIYLAGEAPDLLSGVERARESLRGGGAKQSLKELVDFTQSVAS